MKMGGTLFWGIILILIGTCLIIKVVFNVDFPIVKVIIAFIFIYFGIKILIGRSETNTFRVCQNNSTAFSENTFKYDSINIPKNQSIVFGKGVFDLRNLDSTILPKEIHINTVFGSTEILIDKSFPVKIKVDAAFAGVTMPNDNNTVLGSAFYKSANFDESKPYLFLKIDVAFSELKIRAY